jgi:hypothetical protein
MAGIHPDPVPQGSATAHAVDQDVGRLKRRSRFCMPLLPALETSERFIYGVDASSGPPRSPDVVQIWSWSRDAPE